MEVRDEERKSRKEEEETVKRVEKGRRKVEENGGNGKQIWVLFGKGADKELHGRNGGG